MIVFVKEIFPVHIEEEMKDVQRDVQGQPKKRTVYKNKSENWRKVKDQKMRAEEMKDVREQSKAQYLFGKRYGGQ